MALLFTEPNEYLHIRRAHLNIMLWKAADQQGPPKVDIKQFDCEVKGGIPSPRVDIGLLTPQGPIYVINCGCKSVGDSQVAIMMTLRC